MLKYITIDIGSTYLKSALLEPGSDLVLEKRRQPSPARILGEDSLIFEVPADAVVRSVWQIIEDYTRRYTDVCGVLLATQMHGFVYQTPNRPDVYVSWQDMRCLHRVPGEDFSYLEHLKHVIPEDTMAPCGVSLKPSLGVCNLYTMLREEPSMPQDGTLYTLGSYVIHALTGNNICHVTNAAPLGIYDVSSGCWNDALLRALGLEKIRLPAVAEGDGQICGSCCSNGQELKVYPDYGDQQVAVLGCGAGPQDAVINIATAAQVLVIADRFQPGDFETRPYFSGQYIRTVSNMPGGRNMDVLIGSIQKLVRELCGTDLTAEAVWERIHRLQLDAPAGLQVDMGFFEHPDQKESGWIRGIRFDNLELRYLFSAVFQSMADTYWKNIQVIAGGKSIDRIVCAGGAARKTPELIREIAGVSHCQCGLPPAQDESVEGFMKIARRYNNHSEKG